jgi:D-mannonate dehydratase
LLTKAKLGLPGREDEIATVCELIQNMGALNIPVWCYEWMVLGVPRTSTTLPSRGGALVTGYDNALFDTARMTEYGVVSDEQLWANLEYFLKRVLPVAEKANVKLAMHSDHPPLRNLRKRFTTTARQTWRLVCGPTATSDSTASADQTTCRCSQASDQQFPLVIPGYYGCQPGIQLGT